MNSLLIDEGRIENPALRIDLAAAVAQHGGSGSSIPNPGAGSSADAPVASNPDVACAGIARSDVDSWRVALHEAGHCVIGRVTGQGVAGCTIVAGDGFSGLTWGPTHVRSRLDGLGDDGVPDLCEQIGPLMPQPGENRADAAEIFSHVHVRVVDLCAGTASESLFHPDDAPWIAHSDIRQARALASLICSSESAIDAYLTFGRAEASALIVRHRAEVLAIADALMIERTLNAEQIDAIIASAPERARRADWTQVLNSAADFAAHELES